MDDLDKKIESVQQAVSEASKDDPNRASLLSKYAMLLGSRLSMKESELDLKEGIDIARQAVEATSDGDILLAPRLHNLGNFLRHQYLQTKDMNDLDEAIRVARRATCVTPTSQAQHLDGLSLHLGLKFQETGNRNVLDAAIAVSQEAVNKCSNKSEYATYLNNWGLRLGDRYLLTGSMTDLEEAIAITQQAITAHSEYPAQDNLQDISLALFHNNLGHRLGDRFGRTGTMSNLEDAISHAHKASEITSDTFPIKAQFLNNLAIRLGDKYNRTRRLDNLDIAIETARRADQITPKRDPLRVRGMILSNLGALRGVKYQNTHEILELEEAIKALRGALDITTTAGVSWALRTNNLALRLMDRYIENRNMIDLEEAIRLARQAVEAASPQGIDRAMYLNNLGRFLDARHTETKDPQDLQNAFQCFHTALRQDSASIRHRVSAGLRLLSSSVIFEDQSRALQIAETTIQLLPQLAFESPENSDKEHHLLQAANVASTAAAVALIFGQPRATAIAWLETGRSILAGTIRDSRIDLLELRQKHPALASSFEQSCDMLSAQTREDIFTPTGSLLGTAGSRQHNIDDRLAAQARQSEVIEEIRSKPGFESFLLPLSETEILKAAARGPIVIINVCIHCCDALIITSLETRRVPLVGVSPEEIAKRRPELSTPSPLLLEWLWRQIVNPVLDNLGLIHTIHSHVWPRIWWIPTGPVVGFPLHAAGRHLERQFETAMDRVVSSYATSIKEITYTRQQKRVEDPAQSFPRLVLTCMANTPGNDDLDHAVEEILKVEEVANRIPMDIARPLSRKEEVLSALRICEIFHFAGHGEADQLQPLRSKLLLEDWQNDALTVGDLLEINLQQRGPFLAYLSACETSQVLRDQSVDEGIHLSSALRLAGFRHVIGTLWKVNDAMCVRMASSLYRFLQQRGLGDESASHGLHTAGKELRDEWVRSIKGEELDKGRVDGAEHRYPLREIRQHAGELLWVPFVHYGV